MQKNLGHTLSGVSTLSPGKDRFQDVYRHKARYRFWDWYRFFKENATCSFLKKRECRPLALCSYVLQNLVRSIQGHPPNPFFEHFAKHPATKACITGPPSDHYQQDPRSAMAFEGKGSTSRSFSILRKSESLLPGFLLRIDFIHAMGHSSFAPEFQTIARRPSDSAFSPNEHLPSC